MLLILRERTRGAQRGQMVVAAVLLVLLLAVLAGGSVDLYRLQETRSWAYRTAEASALTGVVLGRDLGAVYTHGRVRIDPAAGRGAAEQAVLQALVRRGATASYDVRVAEWGGETIAGYPPVSRADMWGLGSWHSDEPAVGVYLEVEVETFLLGLVNSGAPVTVHAFAASGLAELR
jgi:hypothetical protein